MKTKPLRTVTTSVSTSCVSMQTHKRKQTVKRTTRQRYGATHTPNLDPYPDQKSCDHCGTVARALTLWEPKQIADCGCACHWARRHDSTKKKNK